MSFAFLLLSPRALLSLSSRSPLSSLAPLSRSSLSPLSLLSLLSLLSRSLALVLLFCGVTSVVCLCLWCDPLLLCFSARMVSVNDNINDLKHKSDLTDDEKLQVGVLCFWW